MNRRILAFALFAGVAALGACSGASKYDLLGPKASSGSSSSGGTSSGAASSSGGASSSGAASSSGGGGCERPQDCGKNEYCFFAGCGTAGECLPVPKESDVKSPVCGCDGVTYWNESIAAQNAVSMRANGVCEKDAQGCSLGMQEVACKGGAVCAAAAAVCTPTVTGTCWRLPSKCPKNDEIARSCRDGKCDTTCALMEAHVAFSAGIGCPP